jgi:hypothetical protein
MQNKKNAHPCEARAALPTTLTAYHCPVAEQWRTHHRCNRRCSAAQQHAAQENLPTCHAHRL